MHLQLDGNVPDRWTRPYDNAMLNGLNTRVMYGAPQQVIRRGLNYSHRETLKRIPRVRNRTANT